MSPATIGNSAAPLPRGVGLSILESTNLELASRILNILNRYKLPQKASATKADDGGSLKFLIQIYGKVVTGEPITMCLPAFPFKSPNTSSKVLGRLPDKAEEFALAHLNGLCAGIKDIYPPGARLMIISDGLVYNGIYHTTPHVAYCRRMLSKKARSPRRSGQGGVGIRRDPPRS